MQADVAVQESVCDAMRGCWRAMQGGGNPCTLYPHDPKKEEGKATHISNAREPTASQFHMGTAGDSTKTRIRQTLL